MLLLYFYADEMNKYIYPQHYAVNVGESAKFTCHVSKVHVWVFNLMYPLSWDITHVQNSIIIDYVRLNHSGSYSCTGAKYNYKKMEFYFIATGTLKVFSKSNEFFTLYCILTLSFTIF